MRSIWNGAISFGLVSIPIKLVNATESHSISFRQIHVSDGGRVRYRKVCELDGEELSSAEIGKGYEEADGSVIPITDEDLAQLPIATAKTIEIVSFVPADQIDPLQMDAAYYLAASGATAAKPYTLLREALKRSRKVAIAKYALRGRERLGMLRVVDDVIAMHGLLWPDEIRAPEGVAPEGEVSVREAELDLADALMATLGEVEMDSLRDDYREAVESMVAAKAGTGEAVAVPAGPAEGGGGQVIDLMAALESSVRAAKASRVGVGVDADAGGAGAEVTPIRRKGASAGGGGGGGAGAPKAVGGKKSTASAAGGRAGAGAGAGKKSTAAAAGAKKKSAAAATKKAASAKGAGAKPVRAAATATATAKKAATPRKRSSA